MSIRGEEVNCLLDTGSQVTTIPQSFYKQHLSEQEIKPLFDLLEEEGAAGQSVPYLGYVELAIEAVRKHIQELLDSGVIRESELPFSSPNVVVRKNIGQIRLCIDYRRLNFQTIKDADNLPKLEDTFSALNGAQSFSVLDLKSGYYQINVEEADKPKTAFVCPLGFWEFNRMPQGVTNALSTFQRLMEKCMGDMHLKDLLVFLDDLIVFSRTLEEHEKKLMKVLARLKEFGLKLSPEKCVFFQTSVHFPRFCSDLE